MSDVLRFTAFAATDRGGNPAGVVLRGDALTDDEMLQIARDVGYSETAFVSEIVDDGSGRIAAHARYFSPHAEVPFCGHATVASAVALAEDSGAREIVFHTRVGAVELTAVRGDRGIEVSFTSVEPHVRELDAVVLHQLLAALGLNEDDLGDGYPAREAFAGNWHPILVLKDRELFHQFRFAPSEVRALMQANGWAGTVTVLLRHDETNFLARNLFPVARITEDPATGSAAASTGAYLRDIGAVGEGQEIVIHQGEHVGRPSVLRVVVPASGGVVVSGGARRIAE